MELFYSYKRDLSLLLTQQEDASYDEKEGPHSTMLAS